MKEIKDNSVKTTRSIILLKFWKLAWMSILKAEGATKHFGKRQAFMYFFEEDNLESLTTNLIPFIQFVSLNILIVLNSWPELWSDD